MTLFPLFVDDPTWRKHRISRHRQDSNHQQQITLRTAHSAHPLTSDLFFKTMRSWCEAEKSGSSAPTLEPWQNPIIQTLIQERRGCRDKTQRAMLSKQIRKHLRANMRQKRNKRLNDILTEFRDLGNIATINDDPIRHQTKLSSAEPSKEDLTTTLSAIFSSDADRVPVVEASPDPSPFLGIEPFSLAEVQEAMFKMRCGRGADGHGLVLELFKYGPPCLHASLVCIYNEMLCTGQLDSSWRHTFFTMVPKSGDLKQTKNWRPIAIVKITYKILPRCFMIVCNPCWKQNHQWIKLVFDEELVLTTRWLSLKLFAAKAFNGIPKFGLQAWI